MSKFGVRLSKTLDTFDEARAWANEQESRILRERAPNRFAPSSPAPGPVEIEAGELEAGGLIHSEDAVLRRPRFRPSCGVYFLIDRDEIVYVGQATNVHARVAAHTRNWKQFDSYTYIPCPKEQLDALERHYIQRLQPALNVRGIAA